VEVGKWIMGVDARVGAIPGKHLKQNLAGVLKLSYTGCRRVDRYSLRLKI